MQWIATNCHQWDLNGDVIALTFRKHRGGRWWGEERQGHGGTENQVSVADISNILQFINGINRFFYNILRLVMGISCSLFALFVIITLSIKR